MNNKGFFRRPVKLGDYIPKKLSVPGVNLSAPKFLSTLDADAPSYPISLTLSCTLKTPINCISGYTHPDDCVRGSVGLRGVLLKEESNNVKSTKSSPSDLNLPSAQNNDRATESEIPLSKRLAYLLQPPTDVLLSRIGPLEWPGSLFDYQSV